MLKIIIQGIVANIFFRKIVKVSVLLSAQAERVLFYARYRYYFPAGGDSFLHGHSEVKYPENISIGNHVIIGPGCTLGGHSKITIGDHVRISKDVIIETAGLDLSGDLPYRHTSKPISIGKGVWLGARSVVLGGVTIGEHAVVGAASVISKNVPDYAVVVGNGRIIHMVKTDIPQDSLRNGND